MGVQLWEVVGGADKGGILLREGEGTSSAKVEERLATGSIVEEVKLAGERLNYKIKTGSGPQTGWVSKNHWQGFACPGARDGSTCRD